MSKIRTSAQIYYRSYGLFHTDQSSKSDSLPAARLLETSHVDNENTSDTDCDSMIC